MLSYPIVAALGHVSFLYHFLVRQISSQESIYALRIKLAGDKNRIGSVLRRRTHSNNIINVADHFDIATSFIPKRFLFEI